jgi:hypothetical protein
MMAERSTPDTQYRPATFLLIIPGATLIGVGIGLAIQNLVVGAVTGLGAGFLLWGVLVELRYRNRH